MVLEIIFKFIDGYDGEIVDYLVFLIEYNV